MPVKTTASALAPGEAAAHRVERRLQRRAHLAVGSRCSPASRSWSRLATALWLLSASSLAAARRLARSADEIRIGRAHAPQLVLRAPDRSRRRAPSRPAAAGSSSSADLIRSATARAPHRDVGRAQAQRRQRRLEGAAHAVVVADVLGVVGQRRVLAAGRVGGLAVVDDETRPAATLTSSSSMACTNAGTRASPLAAAAFRAAMRASLSPAAIASACCLASAPRRRRRRTSSATSRTRRSVRMEAVGAADSSKRPARAPAVRVPAAAAGRRTPTSWPSPCPSPARPSCPCSRG